MERVVGNDPIYCDLEGRHVSINTLPANKTLISTGAIGINTWNERLPFLLHPRLTGENQP